MGGLRGMVSSARSLGWGKRKGGGGDGEDNQASEQGAVQYCLFPAHVVLFAEHCHRATSSITSGAGPKKKHTCLPPDSAPEIPHPMKNSPPFFSPRETTLVHLFRLFSLRSIPD